GMRMKTFGNSGLHLEQFDQAVTIDAGVDFLDKLVGAADVTGPNAPRDFRRGLVGFAGRLREFTFQVIVTVQRDLIGLLTSDVIQLEQMFEIAFANRLMLFDRAIHQRLREKRFIAFVMTEPTVTPHIDDDVALELTAEIHGKADYLRNGFRIFA